jgi:hypothetical protein
MPSTLTPAELRRLERNLYDAMLADDLAALENILSDDLRYVHSKGLTQDKAAYLKAQVDEYAYSSLESGDDAYIVCRPGLALLSTTVTMKVSIGGKPEQTIRMLISYVWAEEAKGWRLLLRQSAHLA